MAEHINKAELISAVDSWDKFGCMPDGRIVPLRELATPQEYVPYVHYDDVVKAINNMPTIDIITCENCKYSRSFWVDRWTCEHPQHKKAWHDGDWYCADGERRQND